MRFSRMVLSVGMVLALFGLQTVSSVAVRAASAQAFTVATSDMVEVQAAGFQAGEIVAVWLTGPSGQVVATDSYFQTSGQGAANFQLRLSSNAEAGRWVITVHGLDSQREAFALVDKAAGSASEADDDSGSDDEDTDADDDSDTDADGDTDGDTD